MNDNYSNYSYVMNLRIEHWLDSVVVKTMEDLESALLKILAPYDICYYYGNNFQIRFQRELYSQVIKIICSSLLERGVIYKMVLSNQIKTEKVPVGKAFHRSLIEPGRLFDKYKKEIHGSFCLFYDQVYKTKSWLNPKKNNYKSPLY